MPSSCLDVIEKTINKVMDISPYSILDLGVGFGKYGYLCREYLELPRGIFKREDWTTRIVGVEIFEEYIQDHQRAIYDDILILDIDNKDIQRVWLSVTNYDLYLIMDVLEHLHNWKGLLDSIPKDGNIILATPYGPYPQETWGGNEREQHVITFFPEDLNPFFDQVEVIKNTIWCYRGKSVNMTGRNLKRCLKLQ